MADFSKDIIMEGKLFKRGKINKSWKVRWFILKENENNQNLDYYSCDPNSNSSFVTSMDKQDLMGTIDLSLVERIETVSKTGNNNNISQYIIVNKKSKPNKQYTLNG